MYKKPTCIFTFRSPYRSQLQVLTVAKCSKKPDFTQMLTGIKFIMTVTRLSQEPEVSDDWDALRSQMPHTPQEPDANCLDAHRNQISTGARCSLKHGITWSVRCSYKPDHLSSSHRPDGHRSQMLSAANSSHECAYWCHISQESGAHRNQMLTGAKFLCQMLTWTRCWHEPNALWSHLSQVRCSQEPDAQTNQMLLHESDAHRSQILSEAIYYRSLMLTGNRCSQEPNALWSHISQVRCSQEPNAYGNQMFSEDIHHRRLMLTGTRCWQEPNVALVNKLTNPVSGKACSTTNAGLLHI